MRRRSVVLLAALALLLAVALPALAGGGQAGAPGQQKEKKPETPITVSGTIERGTNADGETEYTLTADGKTYRLEAGPRWFFDTYPLEPYVGDAVTIDGEIEEGSDVIDVLAVNGTALRAAGKPPWAGGWKVVGERHPGWSQEKADRHAAKSGDCWPPGHCKDKPKDEGTAPEDGEAPED